MSPNKSKLVGLKKSVLNVKFMVNLIVSIKVNTKRLFFTKPFSLKKSNLKFDKFSSTIWHKVGAGNFMNRRAGSGKT